MGMSRIVAIKTFFQREDKISPQGGRKVSMPELKVLTDEDKAELGAMCCEALGEEMTAKPA